MRIASEQAGSVAGLCEFVLAVWNLEGTLVKRRVLGFAPAVYPEAGLGQAFSSAAVQTYFPSASTNRQTCRLMGRPHSSALLQRKPDHQLCYQLCFALGRCLVFG